VGALRIGDGGIAVALYGSSDLRFFDSTGTLTRRLGRSGSGPTDFSRITGLVRCGGDTLAVLQQARISLVTRSGEIARLIDRGRGAGSPEWVGPSTCDSSVWLRRAALPPDSTGLLQQQYQLSRGGPDSDTLLWKFHGTARYSTLVDGAPAYVKIPYWPEPSWAVHDRDIYWTSGAEPTLQVRRGDGSVSTHEWSAERQGISRTEQVKYEEARARLIRKDPRYARSALAWEQIPLRPTFRPVSSGLLADGGSHVWVRPYPSESDGLGIQNVIGLGESPDTALVDTWAIIGLDDRSRFSIAVPAALRITDVGATEVIGIWTDGDGTESVRAYRLRRSNAQRAP
jgi:hypothetical protein